MSSQQVKHRSFISQLALGMCTVLYRAHVFYFCRNHRGAYEAPIFVLCSMISASSGLFKHQSFYFIH
jgi:hypothetical protein